ncbi:hypothetical protein MW887_000352 [Aspergillus wentii]|nr:hypothetical protein MW887_000352 [Aspergillus wentii]
MSTIRAPSRKLDEFEDMVYEYSSRVGMAWTIDPNECNFRFESATQGPPAQVSYLLTVAPSMCNFSGNLHGGCSATLVDMLSTAILLGISKPGHFAMGGVSRNLKVTYLRPVPVDSEIRVVCSVVHTGRRMALLKTEIFRTDTGNLCLLGEHEKANTDPEVDGKL